MRRVCPPLQRRVLTSRLPACRTRSKPPAPFHPGPTHAISSERFHAQFGRRKPVPWSLDRHTWLPLGPVPGAVHVSGKEVVDVDDRTAVRDPDLPIVARAGFQHLVRFTEHTRLRPKNRLRISSFHCLKPQDNRLLEASLSVSASVISFKGQTYVLTDHRHYSSC